MGQELSWIVGGVRKEHKHVNYRKCNEIKS